jgi:hypothetical protein
MAACGRRDNKTPGQGAVAHSSQTTTIQDALAELDALEKPEGVDAKLWDGLKGALKKALECRAGTCAPPSGDLGKTDHGGPRVAALQRIVSTPPTGDINKVNDFAISDHGDGSYTLSWHYRNLGDYDQNGVVGVSDITPLAMHFGKTYNFELEANTIQAVADGSLNGTVGIEDVTQIAMYFGVECAGYSLRTSPDPPASVAETTELDFLPLDLAQGEGRIAYGADHPLPSHTYIAVVPVDAEGAFGELSNVVLSPNHSPGAALTVDPAEGDAPLTVGLDAGESSDMDGPIAKYEWDWEGDGVWDYDSGTLSYVEHVYETPDFYYPVVRVTDAEGAQDTAEAAVFAGQWRISTVLQDIAGYDTLSTNLEAVNGNPAISLYCAIDTTGPDSYVFVRANDANGAEWGNPVETYPCSNDVAEYNSLIIANGNPAMAFLSGTGDYFGLVYVRANDATGSSWGTPVEVDSIAGLGDTYGDISMAIVNGRPAIAYYRQSHIWYIHAADANGNAWGVPAAVSPDSGRAPCLSIVDGAPAISYQNNDSGLRYIRANNIDGDSWGDAVIVDGSRDAGFWSSMAVVNGNPAIAYYEWGDYHDLKYVRANDPIGNTWKVPVIVDDASVVYKCTSLAVINGYPAICYAEGLPAYLHYVRAADENGESWRAPVVVDENGEDAISACLKVINGHPAISYIAHGLYDSVLRFITKARPRPG